jgi:hypothetical protein
MILCDLCRVERVFTGTSKGFFCKYCINLPITGSKNTFVVGADYEQASIGIYKTPSDVKTIKDNLAKVVISLNNDISSCSIIPDDVRLAWLGFKADYEKFYGQSSTILSSDKDFETALSYQDQIRTWQGKISFYCKLSYPILPDAKASNPTPTQTIDKALDTGRSIAIIGGILGLGILALVVYQAKKNAEQGYKFLENNPELVKMALI